MILTLWKCHKYSIQAVRDRFIVLVSIAVYKGASQTTLNFRISLHMFFLELYNFVFYLLSYHYCQYLTQFFTFLLCILLILFVNNAFQA